MLSPATLDRVSSSYRRGYYDGYNGTPQAQPAVGFAAGAAAIRPFANADYEAGLKAGANDRKWNDHFAARNQS